MSTAAWGNDSVTTRTRRGNGQQRPPPGVLHPTVAWNSDGTSTQVLTEQLRAVDNDVHGPMVGHLLRDDMVRIDEAIEIILDLK